ncbi:hypothetical protein GCM10020254_62030 [Streptomyces goshikiensis]
MDLDDGGARAAGVLGLRLIEEAEGGQVQPERDPDPGVGAGRDLRRPVLYPRHPLRLPRGERPPDGGGPGRGPGQAVRDGIEEGPHQGLRFRQPERPGPGQRRGVRLVGQGGGDRPQVPDIRRVERAGEPGVDAVGG